MHSYLSYVILFGILGAVGWGMWRARRNAKLSPRQQRQAQRWYVLISASLWAAFAMWAVYHHQYISALIMSLSLLIPIFSFMQTSATPGEAGRNYLADPHHCGLCDYDLTGNISGICPECGWVIPQQPPQIESPRWMQWWSCWKIDFLENWRKSLIREATLALSGVLLVITLGWNGQGNWVSLALFGILSLNSTINSVRIVQYGLRERRKPILFLQLPTEPEAQARAAPRAPIP